MSTNLSHPALPIDVWRLVALCLSPDHIFKIECMFEENDIVWKMLTQHVLNLSSKRTFKVLLDKANKEPLFAGECKMYDKLLKGKKWDHELVKTCFNDEVFLHKYINVPDLLGRTLLMYLAYTPERDGYLEMLKTIIPKANLDLQDFGGWTALMLAVKYSNDIPCEKAVQLLIDAGANLNIQDRDGWTALMIATRYSDNISSIKTVEMLISNGADLNLRQKGGFTAFMLSSRRKGNASGIFPSDVEFTKEDWKIVMSS